MSSQNQPYNDEETPNWEPPVPAWARCFPPLHAVLMCFVYSLMRPDDDFLTSLKKQFLGYGAICAIWAFLTSALMALATSPSTAAELTFLGVSLATVTVVLSSWVVAKRDPIRAAVFADVTVAFGGCAPIIPIALSAPTYPVVTAAVALAFLVSATRNRLLLVAWPSTFAALIIGVYNSCVLVPADDPDGFLLAIPDGIVQRTAAERAFPYIHTLVFVALFLVIQESVQREGVRRTDAAKASLDVASALAHALGRYNTAEARQRIEEARTAQVVDADLLGRFESIVENLDQYRPHLPNWLVDRSEGAVDEDEGDLRSAGMRSASGSSSEQLASGTEAQVLTAIQHGARRSLSSVIQVKVVAVEVRFALGGAGRGWQPDAGHELVDHVYEVAAGTAAAVHAFIGDGIHVTWNAASSVVQPEVKAVRFLCRLREVLEPVGLFQWAAAWAGEGSVQLAGRARQQALLVGESARAAEGGRRTRAVAEKLQTCAVNGAVYVGSKHAMHYRGASVYRTGVVAGPGQQPRPQPQYGGVYEAVAEHDDEVAEEWLYAMQENEAQNTTDAALCRAVELASLEGKLSEAIAAVDGVVAIPPGAAMLRDALENALDAQKELLISSVV